MRIVNLGSGSKGNCTFIQAGNAKILLDLGFTFTEITKRLQKIGETPENIDAIIVTHEHTDHIKGLKQFLKKYSVRCYVHEDIVQECTEGLEEADCNKIVKISSYSFGIGNLRITPCKVPHDSKVCLAYVFEYGNKRFSIATDLGFMPEEMMSLMQGSDLVYIESNHDRKMLLGCKYPYIVKQRIMGEYGHLSNDQASEIIVRLAKSGTRYFVLSHLSENSNTPEVAYLKSAKALENAGFVLEKDVYLRYSRQDGPGNNFYFSDSEV